MIRVSEMVLPGHPDKVCDIIADAIIAEAYRADPHAYAQVEVGIWCDSIWLSGSVAASVVIEKQIDEVVRDTLNSIGLHGGNTIAAKDYAITCNVGVTCEDPIPWTHHVNDQAVVIGWAGYDAKTRYLPPEHFMAHTFREALTYSYRSGALQGEGPDGKLMVRMREEGKRWMLEHLLITMQQRQSTPFTELCGTISKDLKDAYQNAQELDGRWVTPWKDVELLINPNGPFIEGCSLSDNGQTGRKLVMDFYGPRIPIGGGALSGKHLTHIDRAGAYTTRQAAVAAVKTGAKECAVMAVYAPNINEPLEVIYEMSGRGTRQPNSWFGHDLVTAKLLQKTFDRSIAEGLHFWDLAYGWNTGC
jgi:S-adenosylmethionine synthetase